MAAGRRPSSRWRRTAASLFERTAASHAACSWPEGKFRSRSAARATNSVSPRPRLRVERVRAGRPALGPAGSDVHCPRTSRPARGCRRSRRGRRHPSPPPRRRSSGGHGAAMRRPRAPRSARRRDRRRSSGSAPGAAGAGAALERGGLEQERPVGRTMPARSPSAARDAVVGRSGMSSGGAASRAPLRPCKSRTTGTNAAAPDRRRTPDT